MARISRFIEYRRVAWIADGFSLEDRLRVAWARLPNNTDRIVQFGNDVCVMGVSSADHRANGFAIHCARYAEQQGVGVLDMTPAPVGTLRERRPGNDENFLNTDFFAMVSGDHVITLNAMRNAASLRSYLHALFQHARLEDGSTMFDLLRIADANEMARIDAVGVQSVKMGLGIEEATADRINEIGARRAGQSVYQRIREPMIQMINSIGAMQGKPANLANSRKGTMQVLINIPSRDLIAGKVGIDGVAEGLVQDEDATDFVIMLRNGETITPDEIAVKKRVTLERLANTVRAEDVWREMANYMNELRLAGQLDM